MAFQSSSDFLAFLQTAARSSIVSERAAAANFILEERLSDRETAFLAEGLPPAAPVWDSLNFLSAYGNHFARNVGVSMTRPQSCHTFDSRVNRSAVAAVAAIESHRDVVRMESVDGLFQLNKSIFDSGASLAKALGSLVVDGLALLDHNARDQLQLWLDGANGIRDARPMFAVPWGEIEPLLDHPTWASDLRDAMGLVHLGGTATAPLPVVLMRYNLSRSETMAQRARLAAWAATPTVLEAGSHKGPNPAFFPFPPAALSADALGFGQTVDLSVEDSLNNKSELLHFRIDYELADFYRIGELTDRIDDPQLNVARIRHLDLLEKDLNHWSDVPS